MTAPLYPPLVVVQKLRFDMRQVIAACVGTLVPREHLDHLDLELSPNWPVRGQFKSRWIGHCVVGRSHVVLLHEFFGVQCLRSYVALHAGDATAALLTWAAFTCAASDTKTVAACHCSMPLCVCLFVVCACLCACKSRCGRRWEQGRWLESGRGLDMGTGQRNEE